ncbi:MAG TPA: precorrin-2 C(20)-methyltransferase [Dehalococcoidia bacterium]|nr:precorrin-2 C(20)-methyltransferase [Dehalococcoidia bacterium]
MGTLFGVGVGPGDPELLTLKALRIIRAAAVICAPQSETRPDSYALGIIREYLDADNQEVLRLTFPVDDPEGAAGVWRSGADTLAQRLYGGQDVAFITEGDPMLFSTFIYMLEAMTAEHPSIPVEIIPGVSSVMAAAASSKVPLATHGQRLAVLPTVYGIDDLSEAIASYDTIVLMKVNRELLGALENLDGLGLAGKSVFVRRVSTPSEKVVSDVKQLTQEDVDYFSLLIVKRDG